MVVLGLEEQHVLVLRFEPLEAETAGVLGSSFRTLELESELPAESPVSAALAEVSEAARRSPGPVPLWFQTLVPVSELLEGSPVFGILAELAIPLAAALEELEAFEEPLTPAEAAADSCIG